MKITIESKSYDWDDSNLIAATILGEIYYNLKDKSIGSAIGFSGEVTVIATPCL